MVSRRGRSNGRAQVVVGVATREGPLPIALRDEAERDGKLRTSGEEAVGVAAVEAFAAEADRERDREGHDAERVAGSETDLVVVAIRLEASEPRSGDLTEVGDVRVKGEGTEQVGVVIREVEVQAAGRVKRAGRRVELEVARGEREVLGEGDRDAGRVVKLVPVAGGIRAAVGLHVRVDRAPQADIELHLVDEASAF